MIIRSWCVGERMPTVTQGLFACHVLDCTESGKAVQSSGTDYSRCMLAHGAAKAAVNHWCREPATQRFRMPAVLVMCSPIFGKLREYTPVRTSVHDVYPAADPQDIRRQPSDGMRQISVLEIT